MPFRFDFPGALERILLMASNKMKRKFRHGLPLIAVMLCGMAVAGEIPGLRPSLPPSLDTSFELSFSNDFLGRGGSVDDFRTLQIVAAADFGNRWFGLLDHSVLTLSDPQQPGRIDQLSVSLGYRLLDVRNADRVNNIDLGVGVRSVGDFSGERTQNGFHRLVGSDVEVLPYTDVDGTSPTVWIDAQRFGRFHDTPKGWRVGYWLRGSALVTGDGERDAAVTALGTLGRKSLDLWAGLRQDWRSGYDEPVQRATADAEEDLAFVLGVRFGSLVLETVQQFDNDASWGQLRLLSHQSDAEHAPYMRPRIGLELGILFPDVHLHLAGRWKSSIATGPESAWSESIIVSADLGEPQYDDNPAVFVESRQLAIGLEWERPTAKSSDWMRAYFSVAAGWRREQLVGDGALLGLSSRTVDRPVVIAGAGLRFHASALGKRSRYRIQTGITAWIPTRDARLSIDTLSLSVQEPALALSTGVSFDFD